MAKDISIIIVNYNVRHFLRRCLESVYNSKINDLDLEVFVVDNASIDGSIEMVRKDFKAVHLIANEDNVGFSVANNQAIKVSTGKHILILNPDTVLQEDTLQVCYDYMEGNEKVGALGVKMIDGSGNFLPESKRDLPTVWNSIAKLSGLAALFPKSKLFNGYALGHLDSDQNHVVKVLCGAFMYIRKSVVEDVGMFDERFFMYGEDIDWSRRIGEGGYEIHYLADTMIIHYKGESTKKTSLSYVKTFYSAMGLYVEKHYAGRSGKWFASLLKLGISFRAAISGLKRLIAQLIRPIIDVGLITIALKGFSLIWAKYYFNDPNYYASSSLNWNILMYAFIWAFVLWFMGYYQKPSLRKRLVGVFSGLLCILIFYALLPDHYRSSRLIILAGTLISFVVSFLTSSILDKNNKSERVRNILIVAQSDIAEQIKSSLQNAKVKSNVLGIVNPIKGENNTLNYLNDISQLDALSKVLKADEIIFSTENLEMKEIMKQMMSLDTRLSFKIAGDDSLSIIGSNSKNSSGELYSVNINYNLSDGYYIHIKRVLDFTVGLVLLIFSPILVLFNRLRIINFYRNVFQLILGIKTLVGYSGSVDDFQNLPELNSSLLSVPVQEESDTHKENMYYARDYSVWTDVEILLNNLNKLS